MALLSPACFHFLSEDRYTQLKIRMGHSHCEFAIEIDKIKLRIATFSMLILTTIAILRLLFIFSLLLSFNSSKCETPCDSQNMLELWCASLAAQV